MMKAQETLYGLYSHKPSILSAIAAAFSRMAKPAVLITLGVGVYLHVTRLFIGAELLIEHIYTATFDVVFALPMLAGAIGILTAWKHIVFRNRFEKGITAVTGAYFWVSVPLHVQTWLSQSTDYILIFPKWYSLVFLVYSSLLMLVWQRLKIVTERRS